MKIYDNFLNSFFKHERNLDSLQRGNFGKWTKVSAITDIYSSMNKKIGEIVSLIGDPRTDEIEYVVFKFEDALGIGNKTYFIPWNEFSFHNMKNVFFTPIELRTLIDAPSFHGNHWPEDIEIYLEDVRKYWKNYLPQAYENDNQTLQI